MKVKANFSGLRLVSMFVSKLDTSAGKKEYLSFKKDTDLKIRELEKQVPIDQKKIEELETKTWQFKAKLNKEILYQMPVEDFKNLKAGKSANIDKLLVYKYPHVFTEVKDGNK